MTAEVGSVAPPTAARWSVGDTLVGTGTLLRFALRRDRVRLPVWLGSLVFGTVVSASSFSTTYVTAEDRAGAAETLNSPAGLAMSGPARYLDDYHFGSMLGHQMIGFVTVLVGLMSVLIVVRHTRTEEETGRAELVRAAVVGRHAYLTAALLLAALANVALGLLLALGLGATGMVGITWSGSLLYGATHTAVGLVFAGVAAVTVQFTANSRGASGTALTVVGASFVLRAIGDVGSDALSWLSPIGWAQRTYVYLDNRWWPLLLALAVAAGLVAAGYRLSVSRDVGSGLRPARAGRRTATEGLGRPLGFALRLHRGLLFSFGAGVLVLGAMYGSLMGDVEEMIKDVDLLEESVNRLGGTSIIESFAAMVIVVPAIVVAIHVVMAALRPRSEETSGRAEPLLATALSRAGWLGSHLVVALAGGTVLLAVCGFGFGALGAVTAGDGSLVGKLTWAALAYAPALWVTGGVAVVLFGWLPRACALAWVVPVYAFVVGYLGEILQFPGWLKNLSPFGHVPQLPAQELNWTPLLILTALAAALVAFGLFGFGRRDLETT